MDEELKLKLKVTAYAIFLLMSSDLMFIAGIIGQLKYSLVGLLGMCVMFYMINELVPSHYSRI